MDRASIHKGGAVGLKRVLGGVASAFVLTLALSVAPASAKQVYDYVYSGTFIDGTGSVNGTFPLNVGGPAYDETTERLVVPVGANPGYATKFTKAGAPDPFSALSSDTLISCTGSSFECGFGTEPEIAIDNTGGPAGGNIYINRADTFGGPIFGFKRDGSPTGYQYQTSQGACGIGVGPDGDLWATGRVPFQANGAEQGFTRFTPTGKVVEYIGTPSFNPCHVEIDSDYSLYVVLGNFGNASAIKLNPKGEELFRVTSASSANIAIDSSNDDVFVLGQFDGTVRHFDENGAPVGSFGQADPSHSFLGLTEPRGIAVDPVTHDVWIANRRDYGSGVRHVERFERSAPITVPTTTVEGPLYAEANATIRGTLNADGIPTTDCHFEWGPTQNLGNSAPCNEGNAFAGSSDNAVTASLSGLTKGTTYWYRLSAKNGNERVSLSGPQKFIAQGKPKLGPVIVDKVNTDGARLNAEINPNGGNTSYHFEYGTAEGVYEHSTPESTPFGLLSVKDVSSTLTGLSKDTTYHFRVVVTNEAGTTFGEDQVFKTYASDPATDPCPNAEVRQQTESSLLLDCRAYELVSAANAGGYDVVSDLTPGLGPYPAYPRASDRALYSVDHGLIPGVAGDPTNFGRDPYVAVRGPERWTTRYVGVPAHGLGDDGSYGSPLLAANPGLAAFAFGGEEICDPCFPDGSTNIPLRLPDGSLVKGMAGSQNPAADPVGEVRQPFSADGSHFVFASTEQFESAANAGTEWIYSRDLNAGTTQLVSTMPGGAPMVGQVAQLAISADGSRVLVGTLVGTDAAGNEYFDLYMHMGTGPGSVEVVDTASGVLFSGMTEDGTTVFFTTPDQLVGDGDSSPDLFRADVSGSSSDVTRVSIGSGGSGNTDACAPVGEWNVVSGGPNCGVVAMAGGAGVASGDGTVYFVSPELLDGAGNGQLNQPNLYVARPEGEPHFVGRLEIDNPAVVNGVEQPAVHSFEDFQVSRDGRYAAFSSTVALTGYPTLGHSEIYRHDAVEETVDCASCAPTGGSPATDVLLSPYGLNLTDDGRVFFTTLESFALRDTNERHDAYEWSDGAMQLISRGTGGESSSLASVSADGRNAFFFTRDKLVPGDENGGTVKLYTARENGGYLHDPAPFPCAASDECHGAGTEQPPPPNINTYTGSGRPSSTAQPIKCKPRFVKRRGVCVRRSSRKQRRDRKAARKQRQEATHRNG